QRLFPDQARNRMVRRRRQVTRSMTLLETGEAPAKELLTSRQAAQHFVGERRRLAELRGEERTLGRDDAEAAARERLAGASELRTHVFRRYRRRDDPLGVVEIERKAVAILPGRNLRDGQRGR